MSDRKINLNLGAGIDPRIARTRGLLADALMSLGAESPVDDLAIGALVEEAGISRSTFYQHFASKDDFLVRSFVNMLGATDAAYARAYPDRTDILPAEPLFQHVASAPEFVRSMVQSEIFPHQMAAGEVKLRELAQANLDRRMAHWTAEQRRDAAIFIAGGFIALLRWWMQGGLKQSPERMQAAFAQLTERVLADVG